MNNQRKIIFTSGSITIDGILNETENAEKIWSSLPLDSSTNTWGDEIYFSVPVDSELENSKEIVDLGDIGFWPPGNAICLFFGPTPISSEGEIRPASSVNIVGKLIGNLEGLKLIKSGSGISVVKSDQQ
jgi:hypothetical protein|tara:strand:- start:251 stop:637 length:387 start_codon:yes stop_codon:yes gene_type:complete